MRDALRRNLILILLCLVFSASGCRTVPVAPSQLKYEESVVLDCESARILEKQIISEKSKKEKNKEIAKKQDPVWNKIRGQKIDPAKEFTLTELIGIGLKNNPATRQQWQNTRAARAKEKQAQSRLYPSVDVSAAVTREKQNAANSAYNINDTKYGPSAKITYLILDFGGRSADIEETLQGIISADSMYNQAIQDLLLSVEKNYCQFYSAQSAEAASEDDVKNAKADFEAAQQKFDAGLVAKLDVLQAQSDYENSLYMFESAKGDVKTAQANLALSIGVPADTKFQVAPPVKPFPRDIDEEDVTLLIEDALTRRPDIVSMRADVKAREAAVRSARSDLLPSLSAGADAASDKYKYHGSSQPKNTSSEYSVYASVDWDLFDGFYNINKKIESDRELDMARDNLAQKELSVSAEVWIKYYDFVTALNKLIYSESFLTTARKSYELALESYNAGLKSILDLLQSQSKLSQAKSRFIESDKDVFVAFAELAHAKGSLDNVIPRHNTR